MFAPLLRAWLAHERGDVPHPRPLRAAPPHRAGLAWDFACACGHRWTDTADAVWRDNDWRGPMQSCPRCPRLATGTERPGMTRE